MLLILLFSRVYVTVGYNTKTDSAPSVKISYLFLKFGILPKKQKKINLRDYSYKNFTKSESKRRQEKQGKASKKTKTSKKTKSASRSETDAAETKKDEKKNTVAFLWDIRELIFDTLKRFPSKLRLDVSRLKINVGAKDAASAAITYGIITEAVGAILAVLDCFTNVKRKFKNEVEILPDFVSGKIDADVLIRLSISPASMLSLAFGFVCGFVSKIIKKNITK